MSDEKRTFIRSSRRALHRPNCYELKRLKGPTETLKLNATDLALNVFGIVPECCWQYARVEQVRLWRWFSVEETT